MADFKTALEALTNGELDINALSKQLDKLLRDNPKFANRMLIQLDEVYEQKKIEDNVYATLKRQINKYRRAHAVETEDAGEVSDEATVFAQDDNFAQQEQAEQVSAQASPPQPSTDEDATEVRSDEDATEVRSDGDATEVMSGDKTDRIGTAGEDTSGADFFDLDLQTDTGAASATGATGPTGTGLQEPHAPADDLGRDYGPGDIIKHRFKLIKVLGIGGMGKVFMATDLLKEEARDKKPHVAIKLLNDDFKDHPEAFISLQRESSRQQKLAHPNIATIYDFDRVGGPGTPVYITMELMEGMELKDYIKKNCRKQGGIPFEDAYKIIEQLCSGLIYAHDRRLVHSDFKPGNCFYCNDGTVKTLDFGIARAVKNPVTGEAEKTLFDPGKLGALTPAYASLEMLEGEEPDTRDDTYALGCVAYELLTGKHPFNKLPATTARENGLVPPLVKSVCSSRKRDSG